jgi:hypothetical protein
MASEGRDVAEKKDAHRSAKECLKLKLILLKKHIFRMLCWMPARSFYTMRGIDESTEV